MDIVREIKFRAKNQLGNWHYGSIIHTTKAFDCAKGMIIDSDFWAMREENGVEYTVDTKTIGQFTGLYDKNKEPIYERGYTWLQKLE